MKLEKKHWIIIGVVVAIIAIWYFFLRKKKTESGYAGVYGVYGNESNLTGIVSRGGIVGNIVPPSAAPIVSASRTTGIVTRTPGVGTGSGPQQSFASKCYCGLDDSTPRRQVWNVSCCNKGAAAGPSTAVAN